MGVIKNFSMKLSDPVAYGRFKAKVAVSGYSITQLVSAFVRHYGNDNLDYYATRDKFVVKRKK